MSRQSRPLLICCEDDSITICGSDLTRPILFAPVDGLADPESTASTPSKLVDRLVSQPELQSAIHGANVTVVLGRVYCPGLAIDLGQRPTPKKIRYAFARSRFQSAIDQQNEPWEIRLDPNWLTGTVLGFAVSRALIHQLETRLGAAGARSVSIVPTFVWGWHLAALSRFDGFFVTASRTGFVSAMVQEGRPLSLTFATGNIDQIDWDNEILRHTVLHGSDRLPGHVRVILAPSNVCPMTFRPSRVKVELMQVSGGV